jgi:hypothetical protein
MSPCSQHAQTILTLPPELIEKILIICAADSHPSSIAKLAYTCTHFHRLIYQSDDIHLWREVFLATFDDPRLISHTWNRALVTRSSAGERVGEVELPLHWMTEFVRRLDAKRTLNLWGRNFALDYPAGGSKDVRRLSYGAFPFVT